MASACSIDGHDKKELPKEFTNSIGMKFVWIPPGTFLMGSTAGQSDEQPVHQVTLSAPFWMGKYEVTQAQWEALMGSNPSYFKGGQLPVENVSWDDAMEFCRKLTERERQAGRLPTGTIYTLPTEAQWEYAARAGTETPWSTGDAILAEDANILGSVERTVPVGSYPANRFGLHDLHGNVWEWVEDCYAMPHPADAPTDGSAQTKVGCDRRGSKGGSWVTTLTRQTPTFRGRDPATLTSQIFGFRIARDL